MFEQNGFFGNNKFVKQGTKANTMETKHLEWSGSTMSLTWKALDHNKQIPLEFEH